jgi:uncharacterized protein YcfL
MMKTMQSTVFVGGLLAALLWLSGCRTSMNTVERAEPTAQSQLVADKRVLTDASLNRKARIRQVKEAMTPGGVLRVQVELENVTGSMQRFNYHFEWLDEAGMQVNTPATAAWIPVQVEGKESRFISAVAPTAGCKDFRLKLIEGR